MTAEEVEREVRDFQTQQRLGQQDAHGDKDASVAEKLREGQDSRGWPSRQVTPDSERDTPTAPSVSVTSDYLDLGLGLDEDEDEDFMSRMDLDREDMADLTEVEAIGGDDQEGTSSVWRPLPLNGRPPPHTPPGSYPGDWPADGFSDDDPATIYMMDIMWSFHQRCGKTLALRDVVPIRTPEDEDAELRPFQQIGECGGDMAVCNFLFQHPDYPAQMMGKVDCSKVGLTVIIQGIRAVVNNYMDRTVIPRPKDHVERLNSSNGAMEFKKHLEEAQTCYVLVEPYMPEGIRSALSALQAAARYSSCRHVIFYTMPLSEDGRKGKLAAILDIHPIMGWEF